MEYKVLHDAEKLASSAADLIEHEIRTADRCALGLAGGSTPRATYQSLVSRDIDWSTTTTWLTDERWVAPTSPDANQRMVRDSLVSPTGVEFLAPDTTLKRPSLAASSYTEKLIPMLGAATRRIALLGIGTDGHTASLFPGTSALESGRPRYVDNYVSSLETWRLTATFDLLAESHAVLFLVAGLSKAEMIASIAAGADVPANRVTARESVLWLLDREAASQL